MNSPSHPAAPGPPSRAPSASALAVLLVALNLRAAVTSVGPVLEDIRAELRLTTTEVSILASLPVLCFGIAAFFAPLLSRRIGVDRALTLALALMTFGMVLRVSASVGGLFAGTLFAGAAIALGNVLVPALVKRDFPHSVGRMMGFYVSAMAAMAAVAAAATVPFSNLTGWGWRGGLAVWGLPAAIALVVWLARLRTPHTTGAGAAPRSRSLGRNALAWQVTLFMAFQSLGFYALVAWLPAIYRSHGISPERAGFLLSIVVITGVPIALIVPRLVARTAQQRAWTTATTAITGMGLLGILIAPSTNPILWSVVLGIGTGAAFPLALTLVVLRSRNAIDAARLSAMTQGVGYLIAAAGPLSLGAFRDATGGWDAPIILLLLTLIPQVVMGWGAGRAAHVTADADADADARLS